MGKRGKAPGYTAWEQKDKLILLAGWARSGVLLQDIARNIGIAHGTLCEWRKQSPKIDEVLKVSTEVADLAVEAALFAKATTGGDVTAMIFWLKNRKPREWRDKQDIELKASRIVINDDVPGDAEEDERDD